MWFLLLPLVVQALLIVHVIKTGRNQIWIWVLALLSYAGIIAYVAAELLPELLNSRATRRTVRGVKKALDPEAQLRQLAQRAEIGGGVDARQRHAEELLRLGRHEEAVEEYRRTLQGLYEHDPNLMLGLARAQFGARQPAEARTTLDALIRHNPDFRSADGHLLYARAWSRKARPGARWRSTSRWPATTPARKPPCATRACCARRDRTRRRPKHCAPCSRRRRSHRPITGARRKNGSNRRSGNSLRFNRE